MDARDGLHAGAGQKALEKTTLSEARRSRRGVIACGCPPIKPVQSFRSSMQINSTLGGAFSFGWHPINKTTQNNANGLRSFIVFGLIVYKIFKAYIRNKSGCRSNYCFIRFERRILFYGLLRSGNYISYWKSGIIKFN